MLALCVLAYATRQQALALFPAVLTAPLLLGLRRLGRFRTLYFASGAPCGHPRGRRGVCAAVRRSRLLGAYETAGHHDYAVGSVAKWLLWHVAELDLYLGVDPRRGVRRARRSRGGSSTRRSARSCPARAR